ncbi:hypothetical protein WSM22_39600 [Cytophagales bacterium WSM2-2]|nr:hypothetical protein WSM22_39600 [Cytophagales bacterium WSM2-2]
MMRSIVKLSLFAILLLTGCIIGGPVPPPRYFIQISYKSQSGEDLLNPSTPGHLNKDIIKVNDLVTKNGVLTEAPAYIIQPCETYVCQSSTTGLYYVQFIPDNNAYHGTLVVTGSSIDSLTYTTARYNSGLGIKEIIYKGKTIWPLTSQPSESISLEIVR